jgi:hypothetical protein
VTRLATEAFRNDRGVMRPAGTWRGDVRVRVPPFEALELDLAVVFGRPAPP